MANIITLDLNTQSVQYLCKKDKRLKKVVYMVGPITYEPHTDNPFPFLIHEIIEQMLSIKVGAKNLCSPRKPMQGSNDALFYRCAFVRRCEKHWHLNS